jgi:hypothetical protein
MPLRHLKFSHVGIPDSIFLTAFIPRYLSYIDLWTRINGIRQGGHQLADGVCHELSESVALTGFSTSDSSRICGNDLGSHRSSKRFQSNSD